MNKKGQEGLSVGLGILGLIIIVGLFVALIMWGIPTYNVWSSEKSGEAELAQANYNRQIAVVEAEAKLQSAKSLAAAEVERAKGVAQANQIIGDSLKGNEDYLRYLYINGLTENPSVKEIIYIPTEAGIPILEAGRVIK